MSNSYPIVSNEPHFLTFTVVGWIDVFSRQANKDFLLENLEHNRKAKGLRIHAYVIMSNHMHCILSSEGKSLAEIVGEYKRFTALHLIKKIEQEQESRRDWMLSYFRYQSRQNSRNTQHQFWIQDNHAETLYSIPFMMQKLNYIHENPVRAGIVREPWDYIYSSASNYNGQGGVFDVDML